MVLKKFCFSKNWVSSYKYGSKLAKLLVEINDHRSKGVFEKVAETKPAAVVEVRPVELPIGQESVFEKVWISIRETGIIGLYGLGGVGKTTLLTRINNKFSTTQTSFDVVIWVVVSKDHNVEKIQEKIGEMIGLSSESWKNKAVDKKAADLFGVLQKKKFVLLLDDLWERVDLTKVGIPKPSQENGSKLIFTSRFLEVCGEMEARVKIKVECLEPEQAWKLFQEKVGEETLNNSNIRVLAEEVVRQCGGLPLALITIGRAMACKTKLEDWMYAIEMLKRAALPKMEKEVFPLLKFSYDCLSETMRCCLLYCCLYPEDYRIAKNSLIENWFCEGILNEFDKISEARMQGNNIINYLISACLLESVEEEDCVKMHDVIRDMALWIACELETAEEEKFFVKARVQITEAPEVGKWESVRRVSLMQNGIAVLNEAPTSPNLQTLFLHNNRLEVISNGFFRFMPNLKVLNLSRNTELSELPEAISELVSLECLYLSWTNITELPIQMKSLTKLKILDLILLLNLERIPRNLISSFSKLQIFRLMFHVRSTRFTDYPEEDNVLYGGNESLIEELKCLQHLSTLCIEIKTTLALERFLSFHCFKRCTKQLQLRYLMDSKVLNVSSLAKMENLERLLICECQTVEEINVKNVKRYLTDGTMIQTSPNIPCFHTLNRVEIICCDMLRDLTWLILVPNLRNLGVWNCPKMEEIISEEVLSEVAVLQYPFPKLQVLNLQSLPELKSIYRDALPFPCLKTIRVMENCLKLKKLPLKSDGAEGNQISIFGYREWWQNIEWEDEATRNAFLPSFEPFSLEDED